MKKIASVFSLSIFVLLFIFILTTFIDLRRANAHGITDPWVHQRIAKEAVKVWINCPQEINNHAVKPVSCSLDNSGYAKYNTGDDIIVGSGEEDQENNPLYSALLLPLPPLGDLPGIEFSGNEGRNGFLEHFWNPDYPNVGGYNKSNIKVQQGGYNKGFDIDIPLVSFPDDEHWDSSYRLAKDYWENKVIRLYKEGKQENNQTKINKAYYWLGRVVHLLTDLTVPAHVHGLPHDKLFGGTDYFEHFFDKDHPKRITKYTGTKVAGGPYLFENLPNLSNFNWQEIHPDPNNLFKLFWYTAQKTQYFASKGHNDILGYPLQMNGNKFYRRYKTIDGKLAIQFNPSLWANENYYGSGKTVSPISNVANIPINEPGLEKMSDALIPHAMRAVAGLYRLFWYEATGGLIYENFNNNDFNHDLFSIDTHGGPTIVATNKRLEVTIPSKSSGNSLAAALCGKGKLSGDFDVQVDFDLLTWPTSNGIKVGIDTDLPSSIHRASYALSEGGPWEGYYIWINGKMTQIPTTAISGKLRMVRKGNRIEGFYWQNNAWQSIGSFTGSTYRRDIWININANTGTPSYFSGRKVKVAFDNLEILREKN